jgi:hypothetical protein
MDAIALQRDGRKGTAEGHRARTTNAVNLVQQFWFGHRLPDLRAAVGAFIGEVDRRRAPMWCDVLDVHRQARTAWAGHEGWFGIVMVDIGWHVGSPTRRSAVVPDLDGVPQRLMER